MPAPPTSGHISQTSMHKKSRDSKNSSSAAHLNSKTAEDKKTTPGGPGEETDRPSAEPSSEVAKPGNAEDDNAENSNSQLEKAISHPTERKETAVPPEKDEEGENHNKDCENPGNSGPPDDALLQ